MRHMETYKGEKVNDWKCGLKKNSLKQLMFLRAKYCRTFLNTDLNDINLDNVSASSKHFQLASKNGDIDVVKLLESYSNQCDSEDD